MAEVPPPNVPDRNDPPRNAKSEFIAGVRDQLPLLLGVVPFGLLFGALGTNIGLTPFETQGFSLFVFAGSAQFIAAGLIQDGAPNLVLLGTIAVVNLRHLLYSASMAPYVRHLPKRWKWVLSYLLTDEAYAMASSHYRRGANTSAHWFFLGTGFALWFSWQASTGLGILLGAGVPESWPIDFALPLTFLALLAPILCDRPSWASALIAGFLSVVLHPLPLKLGLFISAFVGVLFGIGLENLLKSSSNQEESRNGRV